MCKLFNLLIAVMFVSLIVGKPIEAAGTDSDKLREETVNLSVGEVDGPREWSRVELDKNQYESSSVLNGLTTDADVLVHIHNTGKYPVRLDIVTKEWNGQKLNYAMTILPTPKGGCLLRCKLGCENQMTLTAGGPREAILCGLIPLGSKGCTATARIYSYKDLKKIR